MMNTAEQIGNVLVEKASVIEETTLIPEGETQRSMNFTSKEKLRAIIARVHLELGIPNDPEATGPKARAQMLADGIRPETNEFSRGIIAAREE